MGVPANRQLHWPSGPCGGGVRRKEHQESDGGVGKDKGYDPESPDNGMPNSPNPPVRIEGTDACPVGPVVKVGEDPDLSDDDISDAETKRSRKIASMSTKVLAQGSRTSANAGKPGIVNMDRSTILQGNFVPW